MKTQTIKNLILATLIIFPMIYISLSLSGVLPALNSSFKSEVLTAEQKAEQAAAAARAKTATENLANDTQEAKADSDRAKAATDKATADQAALVKAQTSLAQAGSDPAKIGAANAELASAAAAYAQSQDAATRAQAAAVKSQGLLTDSQAAVNALPETDKLALLSEQRNEAVATRDAREAERKTAEDAVKARQSELDELQKAGTDTAAIAAKKKELEAAQTALSQKQANVTSANAAVTAMDDKIEANPARQVQRINETYAELIAATKAKGVQIAAEQCTGSADEIKNCEDIKKQKVDANKLYADFIAAKRDVELCQVRNGGACPAAKKKQDEAAAALNAVLKTLTQAEIRTNQAMSFKVSDIFNPEGRTARKTDFLTVTNQIANWMITLVSSLAVTALVIGGFMMIISGGDESRLEMGKTIFTYSLIGLAVTLLAYGIIATIQALFYS